MSNAKRPGLFQKIRELYRGSSILEQRKAYYTVLIAALADVGYVASAVGDFLNGYHLFAGFKLAVIVIIAVAGVQVYRKRYYLASNLIIFSNLVILNLIFMLDEYAGRFDPFVHAFYLIPAFGLMFLIAYHKFQALFVAAASDAFLAASLFLKYLPSASADEMGNIVANLVSAAVILTLLGFIAFLTVNEVNRNLRDLERRIAVENRRTGTMTTLFESSRETLSVGEVLRDCAAGMAALIDRMNVNLDGVSGHYSRSLEAARRVHETSRELFESNTRVTGHMDEQDESIKEMSSSIGRMGTSIADISDGASKKTDAVNALAAALEGERRNLEKYKSAVNGISASSRDLSAIAAVIEEIAGKTSLLSMNASIEAAHAGASGRGFAVVAEEIGKLAQRSNENSALIQRNLSKILGDIETAREGNERLVSVLENALAFVSASAADMRMILGEMTALARDGGEIERHMSSLAGVSGTVRRTSVASRSIAGENERGVAGIVDSLGATEKSIRDLFEDSRHIRETVARIRKIGEDNLTVVTALQDRLKEILA